MSGSIESGQPSRSSMSIVMNPAPRLRLLVWIALAAAFLYSSPLRGAATQIHAPASTVSHAKTPQTAYTLPPKLLAKALTLERVRMLLGFGAPAWSVLVLLLALWLRWPASLRNWAERVTRRRWLQGAIDLALSVAFLALLPLPLALYSHHIARAYGLSVQSWAGWSADQAKSLLLSLAVFTPLLLLLFWLIRRSPRSWWLWFWMCTVPIIVFAVFISPMWIDPMFNRFTPLAQSDPQLTGRLEALAQHAGLDIPPSRMFLMQASEKVTGINAYVTGIGASKRIVVWDNTARQLPADQILFITGHEMGHYVLNHIYKGLAFTALSLLGLLWLAARSAAWLARRCGPRWAIRGLDDWAALALLVLVATCAGFLFSPIANAFSRAEEHQADVYGQEAIHGLVADPQRTASGAFITLGRVSLDAPHPNPLAEFWLSTHPSISERVRFTANYNPWPPGTHPRFFPKPPRH